ncbi:MAG: glycosyltransferase family 4 protein [Cytophagaceae bacterium]|nr:glycosyltransferase family 4 protein [Cytophagaceae bacterium]
MNVTLLSTYDAQGGAAIAARRLHDALLRQGVASTMLVQEQRRAHEGVEAVAKTGWQKGLAFSRFALERAAFFPFEREKSVRWSFSPGVMGTDISRHSLVQQADILHLHWVNFGFQSIEDLGKLLALGKPVVWTMHDMWPFTGGCHHSGTCERYQEACGNCEPFLRNPAPNDLSHRVWLRKQKAYANARLRPVGCSVWLANRARRSRLFGSLPVEAIPNPIDTELFKPLEKALAKRKFGLSPDKKLILFAAANVSAVGKGFMYFEKGLHLLQQQLIDSEGVELLIFGGGDETLLENLPFRYHFLGSLNDVPQISAAYSAADVFVTPSLEENLPNTIMEAMACGTPAIGFDVGGIPEMITHRQTGYLARYRAADDLAEGMRWTLEQSPEAYAQLANNARQYVLANYAGAVVAGRYLSLYESILNERMNE